MRGVGGSGGLISRFFTKGLDTAGLAGSIAGAFFWVLGLWVVSAFFFPFLSRDDAMRRLCKR